MHMPQPPYRAAGAEKLRPSSGRKPLQPRNCPASLVTGLPGAKPKGGLIEIYSAAESNKENLIHAGPIISSPSKLEPILDSSLAEELSAVRKKVERLRSDREKVEKMLRDRDLLLEAQMEEIERRGEVQKTLEIEVDRLYRLKQLHMSCMVCISSAVEMKSTQTTCSISSIFVNYCSSLIGKFPSFFLWSWEPESVSDPVVEGEATR